MGTKSPPIEMSETSSVASVQAPAVGVELSGGSRPAPDDVVVALLDGSGRDSVVDGARPQPAMRSATTAAAPRSVRHRSTSPCSLGRGAGASAAADLVLRLLEVLAAGQ